MENLHNIGELISKNGILPCVIGFILILCYNYYRHQERMTEEKIKGDIKKLEYDEINKEREIISTNKEYREYKLNLSRGVSNEFPSPETVSKYMEALTKNFTGIQKNKLIREEKALD